jgi:hypothetical protein
VRCGRYAEGCIQARRSGSRPHPERSRTTVIAAALRGILLAQRGATFTPLRSTQSANNLVATDKPGSLSSTRLETTPNRSVPPHAPSTDRFGNSGESVLLGVFANEGAADEPAGTRSNEDGVGGHQIADACGNN